MINLNSPDVAYMKSLSKEEFHVYWSISSICSYACRYCPSEFHDGKYKYHSLDVVQRTFKKLPTANVMFGGGEPTFHPEFEKLVLEKPDHISISLLTNASRPIAFWERIVDKLDIVITTFHSEYANTDRFLNTMDLIYLKSGRRGQVHLAMDPKNWNICVGMYRKLKEKGIKVTVKPILTSIMNLSNPGEPDQKIVDDYTEEQLDWMANLPDNDEFRTIGLYDKHGKLITKTTQSEIVSSKQNSFTGWKCYTPVMYLYIHWDGEVYDTACRQRKRLGNIHEDFTLSGEPITCHQNFCWCYGDIRTTKIKDITVTFEQTSKK